MCARMAAHDQGHHDGGHAVQADLRRPDRGVVGSEDGEERFSRERQNGNTLPGRVRPLHTRPEGYRPTSSPGTRPPPASDLSLYFCSTETSIRVSITALPSLSQTTLPFAA